MSICNINTTCKVKSTPLSLIWFGSYNITLSDGDLLKRLSEIYWTLLYVRFALCLIKSIEIVGFIAVWKVSILWEVLQLVGRRNKFNAIFEKFIFKQKFDIRFNFQSNFLFKYSRCSQFGNFQKHLHFVLIVILLKIIQM